MMTLRFKSALIHAVLTAAFIVICGWILNMFFHHKHNKDLLDQFQSMTRLIATDQTVRLYIDRSHNEVDREEAVQAIQRYITELPTLQTCSIIDAFDKVVLIIQPHGKTQPEESAGQESLQDQAGMNASMVRDADIGEQAEMIYNEAGKELGKVKLNWVQGQRNSFHHLIQNTTLVTAFLSGVGVFILSYGLILKRYSKEHNRLSTLLGQAVSGDIGGRLDTRLFSKETAELSTYCNRVLTELEQARKQKLLLQDSHSQLDRRYHESLRKLEKQTQQIHILYEEVQEGLNRLFELFTCGLMIIDHEYNIQWINGYAEKLLRYAVIEDTKIMDERIKRCLAPLVRFQTTHRIDDMCAWPQPSLGCAVSCKIRSAAVPTPDASKLFFVTLEEDSGFPKQRTPEFFSHRLVLDILSTSHQDPEEEGSSEENKRLWDCLSRIERYQWMEQGEMDAVTSIRLNGWLQEYFEKRAPWKEWFQVSPKSTEADVIVNVDKTALLELLDTAIEMIMSELTSTPQSNRQPSAIRSYWNSRGKPVIEILIPHAGKELMDALKQAFSGIKPLYCDQLNVNPVDVRQLEHDIRLTVFQFLRQHFRIYTECMYSSGKQLGIVRIVIERFLFQKKAEMTTVRQDLSKNSPSENGKKEVVIKNILQNFLGNGEPVHY